MDQTNGAIVLDLLCVLFLLEEDDEGVVEQMKISAVKRPQRFESVNNVLLDHGPCRLEEEPRKAVWTWRFLGGHVPDCVPDFIF